MFLALNNEPWSALCHGCKMPLGNDVVSIRFETDDGELTSLNGDYHPPCAAPILNVKRAYDMCKRWSY